MKKTITIYAKSKDLNTSPIRSLMRNGEENADRVIICLPRFYGKHDLSEFGFIMEGVNSQNTLCAQTLVTEYDDENVNLKWDISKSFTAVSGPLKLTLKALKPESDVAIMFDGNEVEVCGEDNSQFIPADTSVTLLEEFERAIADFSAKIGEIAEEKVTEALAVHLNGEFVTSNDIRRIEFISQSDYDALENPDNTVLYFIS